MEKDEAELLRMGYKTRVEVSTLVQVALNWPRRDVGRVFVRRELGLLQWVCSMAQEKGNNDRFLPDSVELWGENSLLFPSFLFRYSCHSEKSRFVLHYICITGLPSLFTYGLVSTRLSYRGRLMDV